MNGDWMEKAEGFVEEETQAVAPEQPLALAQLREQIFALFRNRRLLDTAGALALVGVTLALLLYYILGPSAGYFHSDCADSLFWANATVESGKVLDPDFGYAAILPFGSSLWMVPLIQIFGFGMQAQLISMCIFAVLFVGALYFLGRSMDWSRTWSAATAMVVSFALSQSDKLREIMWGHTIYYSLGLLGMFLLLGLVARAWRTQRKGMFWLWSGLAALLCAGLATDGFQVLALTAVPVLGAVVAERFFDNGSKLLSRENRKPLFVTVLCVLGMAAGVILLSLFTKGGKIGAGYATAYSNYSPMREWQSHVLGFLQQFLDLLGISVEEGTPLASLKSLVVAIRLFATLLILVAPLLLLASYRKISDRATRLLSLAHLFMSMILLFGYICGSLSSANWRLTPLLGSGVLTTVAWLRSLSKSYGMVGKRVCVLLLALLVVFSGVAAVQIADMEADYGRDNELFTLIQAMRDHNCGYGYATFWNAGAVTVLSEGEVTLRNVTVNNTGMYPYHYQSNKNWFTDAAPGERYAVVLSNYEWYSLSHHPNWISLTETHLTQSFETPQFKIFVFDCPPLPLLSE